MSAGIVSLAPASASAAEECGLTAANGAAADTFTCAEGTYPTGIVYPLTNGPLILNLNDGATGSVNTTTGGIQVIGSIGDSITIARTQTAAGTGDPSIINTLGAGINITSPDSAISVNLTDGDTGDTPIVVTGATSGIIVNSLGAGNVNVTLSNGTVTGQAGDGIDAFSDTGSATVALGGASVVSTNTGIGASSYGVFVEGATGMTVTGTGSITATGTNYAIGVIAVGDGPIVINETGTITANATYGWGVYALGTAGGTINITTANIQDNQTGGALGGGRGIFAYTTGAVTVNSGTIHTTGISADGISIGGPFLAPFGIAGNTIVNSTAITTNGLNADGIQVGAHGSITINSGTITTTGNTANGIIAATDLSTVNITSGAISATGAGSMGIRAIGQTGVTINANGNITAAGSAISTAQNGVGAGTINIASGAVVRGGGTLLTGATIDATTLSGQTTTINNAGTIRSTNATVAGAAADLAIRGTGGNVTIADSGRIDGRLDFTALTGTNKATVGTTAAGSWHTTGINTFSAGNDTINNAGLISTIGATTIDFGADTLVSPRDVFNNSGRLVAGEATGASTLTVAGLETFNNSGSVFFGSLDGGLTSDGQTNDRIVMTASTGGTAFVGSGASRLFIDTFLGTTAQSSCAAAVTSDCLSLPGGTVSGSTLIHINNTNTTVNQGGFNTGIVVVDATGGSIAAGSLAIDPTSANYVVRGGQGAIDTGFFFYRLVPVGTTQEALVSAPDTEAFEFNQFGAAATDAWYTTSSSWYERQADLRDSGLLTSDHHSAVWVKMYASQADRDSTQTFGGFNYDTSYRQDTAGLMLGADLMGATDGTNAWLIGANIGYVDSKVDFKQSPSEYKMTGPTYGIYGSWLAGPWYFDASVNANYLDLSDTLLVTGTTTHSSGSVKSVGVRGETGYRIAVGDHSTLEPTASLAYVKTSFDNLSVPGGSVEFDDVDSFRGSLGVRFATTMTYPTFRLQPSVYIKAWDEFKGDTRTTLNNPGLPFTASDGFDGAFADVGGQLNVYSDGGLTAFVNVGYKWNGDYTDTNGSLGFRYTF